MVAATLPAEQQLSHFNQLNQAGLAIGENTLEVVQPDEAEDATIEIVGAPGPEVEEVYEVMRSVARRLRDEYGVLVTVTVSFGDWAFGPGIGLGMPRVYVNGEQLELDNVVEEDIEERVIDMVLALLGERRAGGRLPDGLSIIGPYNDKGFVTAAV